MAREMKQNEQEKCPEDALESDAGKQNCLMIIQCECALNAILLRVHSMSPHLKYSKIP